jgi:nitrite reductase (cytochrome c-552)
VLPITDETEDASVWGATFPHEFATFRKTVDMTKTKYGGSEAFPKPPTEKDPRLVVSQSKIEEDPRLKTMWAGYAFAVDFREERGHAYMLLDQEETQRQEVVKQPGTCINCHGSTYTAMMKLGQGNLTQGFEKINEMSYWEAHQHVKGPISCIDCHTPGTMKLRVTRPGFMEGIKALKEHQGIKDYDVNKQASPQEMRTFVCAQCHVEYYFKGKEKRLVFPWFKGLKADEILSYYQEVKHKDWEHKMTGAPALKAQHPEFELYSQGIHARSGVSCVDCHMPYEKVGAKKITNHHVQSPMLNISHACQTCHRYPEAEIKDRVETIQNRFFQIRNQAMDALTQFIEQLAKAKAQPDLDPMVLEKAQDFQRQAQFLLDFVEAENSTGFHAPDEALRVLGLSIDKIRQGQVYLLENTAAEKNK